MRLSRRSSKPTLYRFATIAAAAGRRRFPSNPSLMTRFTSATTSAGGTPRAAAILPTSTWEASSLSKIRESGLNPTGTVIAERSRRGLTHPSATSTIPAAFAFSRSWFAWSRLIHLRSIVR